MKEFPVRHKRRQRGTHSVLAAVAVAWLTLALQPCAMALEADPVPDCPHCPPGQLQDHHADNMAAGDMPCATVAMDCGILDGLSNHERSNEIKLKDQPKDLPVVLLPASPLVRVEQPLASIATLLATPPPYSSAPALHKLYCVYLK